MKNKLRYEVSITRVVAASNQNFSYNVSPFCNGITVKNVDGTAVARVTVNNNVVLQPGDDANNIPGESFSFGGNYGEIYQGRIELKFNNPVGVCLVIEKFYTNYNTADE